MFKKIIAAPKAAWIQDWSQSSMKNEETPQRRWWTRSLLKRWPQWLRPLRALATHYSRLHSTISPFMPPPSIHLFLVLTQSHVWKQRRTGNRKCESSWQGCLLSWLSPFVSNHNMYNELRKSPDLPTGTCTTPSKQSKVQLDFLLWSSLRQSPRTTRFENKLLTKSVLHLFSYTGQEFFWVL